MPNVSNYPKFSENLLGKSLEVLEVLDEGLQEEPELAELEVLRAVLVVARRRFLGKVE